LEFITINPDLYLGEPTLSYPTFFTLFDFRTSLSQVFSTTGVRNEKVLDGKGKHIGNRVAFWLDNLGIFDGGLDLDVTYGLQSCSSRVYDRVLQTDLMISSQPLFIKIQLGAPHNGNL